MNRIHVLPPNVADMIAAGEVVERPASAVKELIENAVDAGATAITAEFRRGGAGFIRVADNGCGMSAEDARAAFLRHATSKIESAEDLQSISTLGFRGEALAAIAAVSRAEVLTRQTGAAFGTALTLNAGRIEDCREAGCPEGTTIILRELFFNTPARQKFLKRDATEAGHIHDVAVKAALGRPDISFRLLKDGEETLHTAGDGKLKSAVYSVFGRELGIALLDAAHTLGSVTVSGFVGKPETARGSRAMQFFFVNGRPVRSRTLYAALEEGFKNALPAGRMPVCVLCLDMPPSEYDINVHPAKAEIKFLYERQIFDALYFAVKGALRDAEAHTGLKLPPAAVSGDFRETLKSAGQMEIRESPAAQAAPASAPEHGDVTAFASSRREYRQSAPYMPPPATQEPRAVPIIEDAQAPEWRLIGQALGGYLLAETPDALWMIDKHAAHERALFNTLMSEKTEPMSQLLLQPQTVALPARLCAALLKEEKLLRKAGFMVEDFGAALLVREVPDFLAPEDAPSLLAEIAEKLLSGGKALNVREETMKAVACKAAIKLTQKSAAEDLKALAARVMEDPDLRHCPHGRPVAIRLTRSQLERQFLRG
ncbi:MAG: DNA mismatch repair endonuclease MutL [Oscillospiraceae bacterium]|nr:DNA mismatch repair endonuclease MutL [Oscillospiraceae bacterium]